MATDRTVALTLTAAGALLAGAACFCSAQQKKSKTRAGKGDALALAQHIPLDGPGNFRDVGGYATSSGKTVKVGRIYRSDSLKTCSKADYAVFATLGLATRMDMEGASA